MSLVLASLSETPEGAEGTATREHVKKGVGIGALCLVLGARGMAGRVCGAGVVEDGPGLADVT